MKEILPEVEQWRQDGEKIVVATVVATRRSAPRPIGASLAISESGKMCGSVSGGCLPGDDPFIGCGTGGGACVSCISQFKFTCDANHTCQ